MPLTNAVKAALVDRFREQLEHARQLYDTIVRNGMRRNPGGATPTNLMNHDKRDAAQFIFFEVAAQFEDFVTEAFKMEVRLRLGVSPKRAEYIMGSTDRGLAGVMGWGAPKTVRERAEHLFGKQGFFARVKNHVGDAHDDRLIHAHVTRNRVAHNGKQAREAFAKILGTLLVPAPERQGLSVGRLLTEHPPGSAADDRWFHRFLASYEQCLDRLDAELVIP
jgi:hypothetical protein